MERRNLRYSKYELAIIKKYYYCGGCNLVKNFINRSDDSIRHTASRLNIKRERGFRYSKKDFSWLFNFNSPISCYCLGLLWADGCIRGSNRFGSCILQLIKKDLLEIKGYFVNFNYSEPKIQKRGWKQQAKLSFHSINLFKEFKKYNFDKKSNANPTFLFNIVTDSNKLYFIMGFLDGDGHIGKTNVIFSGSYGLNWKFLKSFCIKNNIKFYVKKHISRLGHKSSSFNINQKAESIKFLNIIYSNGNLGFSRKYNKYLLMLND